jgi:DNA-binding MarR family transcriptional regulator
VSTQAEDGSRAEHWPPAPLIGRLGFLLKHAQLRLTEITGPALAPHGITGRQLAVLSVLADGGMLSQQQAAQRLAIDRTTMVALIDELEAKGLVTRHPHPEDRRKNVVELTGTGRETFAKALQASEEAERRFLAALDDADAQRFKETLQALIAGT